MLTDIAIRALKAPEKGYTLIWDTNVPGLAVRVTHRGTKAFILIHGRDRKKQTLGRVGELSLAKARGQAMEIVIAARKAEKTELPAVDFTVALDAFVNACHIRNKPSTAAETERLLRRHLSFDKAVGDITTADLTKVLDAIPAMSSRLHTFVAARTLFNWLRKRRYIAASPLAGVDPPYKPLARDRVLSEKELAAVWNACNGTFGVIVRLLILTGQRYGQIVNLRREWINTKQKTITWPREAMKGNVAHTIPYGTLVAKIIASRPKEGLLFPTEHDQRKPFSNYSNSKERLDKASRVTSFTIHDLRRTFASMWAAPPMRVPPHIIEATIAHRGGIISGVAAIYMRYDFLVEARDAMRRWEERLAKIVLKQ